jgi:hypothetical protein
LRVKGKGCWEVKFEKEWKREKRMIVERIVLRLGGEVV